MQELAGLWAPVLLSPTSAREPDCWQQGKTQDFAKDGCQPHILNMQVCFWAFCVCHKTCRNKRVPWGNYHSNCDTLNIAPQQIKGCFFFWREDIKWKIWKLPIQFCHRDASQIILLAKRKRRLLVTAKDHVLILAVAVNSFPMELHLPWEGF